MHINKTCKYIGLAVLSSCGPLSFAGGPLVIEGPHKNTPVTYQDPAITLHIESGDLNATETNAEANAILLEALNLWNKVSTATIELNINTAALASEPDIDASNFDQYIPNVSKTVFNANDGLNPIVYDSDGAIIDAFFGDGQSDNTIGFAASVFNVGSRYFSEGYAVINGKDLGLSSTEFKLLITHEIGHFFGLDHSQVNINNTEDFPGTSTLCSSTSLDNYPVMYPFICRDTESLHSDDSSALSALYPATNVSSSFGILQGRFTDESGNAILGANLWAQETGSGATYSIVSDYLKQGSGYYKLLLPAGNYTLHANSINTIFNGGSSIGPYSTDILDASFTSPHPIAEVSYQGAAEGNAEVITIATGETLNINFSLAGLDVIGSEDDGSSNLFGATSQLTLFLLTSLLITLRRITRYQRKTIPQA